MKAQLYLIAVILFYSTSCRHNQQQHQEHDHDHDEAHGHNEHHEELVFDYTIYNKKYEFFIESAPLVAGEKGNMRVHITRLSDFKPVQDGSMEVVLQVNGNNMTSAGKNIDIRKGIADIDFVPEVSGAGNIKFILTDDAGTTEALVPEVQVFTELHDAYHWAESEPQAMINVTHFSKELSWKTEFATGLPEIRPFGRVIKAAARVQPAVGNEHVIAARTAGIVNFISTDLLEGKEVSSGEVLFTISGRNMADNNLSVRYIEAKNNYERAQANFERMKSLAADQIVSEKSLLEVANEFKNSRAVYNNLRNNFSETGQNIVSPLNGYIQQLYVSNGMYAEAGQPVVAVAGTGRTMLTAHVAQRHASLLEDVASVHVRDLVSGRTYDMDELKARILSYGKAVGAKSQLVPLYVEVEDAGSLFPGSMVEVYLQIISNDNSLVVPNTALLEDQGQYFVWVQVNPELFEKRMVQVGETDGIRTAVNDGLIVGERIVQRGAVMVKLAQASGAIDPHEGHFH